MTKIIMTALLAAALNVMAGGFAYGAPARTCTCTCHVCPYKFTHPCNASECQSVCLKRCGPPQKKPEPKKGGPCTILNPHAVAPVRDPMGQCAGQCAAYAGRCQAQGQTPQACLCGDGAAPAPAPAPQIDTQRREAEEKARQEQARREAELRAQREAEEKARREAEERKKFVEEKLRRRVPKMDIPGAPAVPEVGPGVPVPTKPQGVGLSVETEDKTRRDETQKSAKEALKGLEEAGDTQ